jgi:hypothetical protein
MNRPEIIRDMLDYGFDYYTMVTSDNIEPGVRMRIMENARIPRIVWNIVYNDLRNRPNVNIGHYVNMSLLLATNGGLPAGDIFYTLATASLNDLENVRRLTKVAWETGTAIEENPRLLEERPVPENIIQDEEMDEEQEGEGDENIPYFREVHEADLEAERAREEEMRRNLPSTRNFPR